MKSILFLMASAILGAQFGKQTWTFESQGYFDPLVAEPRAANVSVMAWGRVNRIPFAQNPGARRVWDISLGKEIPIFGFDTRSDRDTQIAAGEWGFGVWIPVSFHMLEDFKDPSNPILNTDYRFSGMAKFQRGIWPNLRWGTRFQFGHESTHLGDEFTIGARRMPGFKRINVSYEYWEYGLSLEAERGAWKYRARHGGIGLWRPRRGYYDTKLLEPLPAQPCSPAQALPGCVLPSENNFEPSFGFQVEADPDSVDKVTYRPFASVDARPKIVYDYNKTAPRGEDRQLSWNVMVGMMKVGPTKDKVIPFNIFFRFYHGVNPNGQFRSERNFTLIGFGIHVPI